MHRRSGAINKLVIENTNIAVQRLRRLAAKDGGPNGRPGIPIAPSHTVADKAIVPDQHLVRMQPFKRRIPNFNATTAELAEFIVRHQSRTALQQDPDTTPAHKAVIAKYKIAAGTAQVIDLRHFQFWKILSRPAQSQLRQLAIQYHSRRFLANRRTQHRRLREQAALQALKKSKVIARPDVHICRQHSRAGLILADHHFIRLWLRQGRQYQRTNVVVIVTGIFKATALHPRANARAVHIGATILHAQQAVLTPQ